MAMDFLGTNISSLNCAAWRVCYNSQPVDEVVWKSKSGTETTVFSNRFICYSNCIPNAQERYILANLSPSRVLVCCPIYAKSYDGTSKEIGKLYVEPDTSSANHMKYCFIANSTYEDKCVPITYRVCATNVSSADMDICFQPSTNWCGYLAQIVGTCTNYELYEDGGMFVLDVMDEAQTKGTHWHPNDIGGAVADIMEFMEGKSNYPLQQFPKR